LVVTGVLSGDVLDRSDALDGFEHSIPLLYLLWHGSSRVLVPKQRLGKTLCGTEKLRANDTRLWQMEYHGAAQNAIHESHESHQSIGSCGIRGIRGRSGQCVGILPL